MKLHPPARDLGSQSNLTDLIDLIIEERRADQVLLYVSRLHGRYKRTNERIGNEDEFTGFESGGRL